MCDSIRDIINFAMLFSMRIKDMWCFLEKKKKNYYSKKCIKKKETK